MSFLSVWDPPASVNSSQKLFSCWEIVFQLACLNYLNESEKEFQVFWGTCTCTCTWLCMIWSYEPLYDMKLWGGSSGLLVKVLACNQKVAGSSPTRVRLFLSPMSLLSSTLKNEVFITASFEGDVKLSVPGSWLILALVLF